MILTEKKTFPDIGETLIYFINEETLKTDNQLKELDALTNKRISKECLIQDFKGKKNTNIVVEGGATYNHIIVYGLGKIKNFSELLLREAIAKSVHTAQTFKTKELKFFYTPLFNNSYFNYGKNIALGYYLSQYKFDKYKEKEESKVNKQIEKMIVVFNNEIPKEFINGLEFGKVLSEGVHLTRDLVNEPASHLHPETLVQQAFAIEKKSRGSVSVQVLDKDECEHLGMGSYLGVAQGSDREPKFIILKYQNPNSKSQKNKKICLVGKSITFDSGGLSLKPSKSMETMKIDMAGGATVLGVFDILTKINDVNIEVWGILPSCENMPSGKALRPGDIVVAMNKKTIEVLNTDAEGRLALADGVAYAEQVIKPDLIIDLATLTGACMVALGTDIAGLFGNDKKAVAEFIKHARNEGEELWELPLYKPYLKTMKSDFADIKNIGGTGYGGAISGALFIGEFIKKTKWLHIDIAGPAYVSSSPKEWISKNATGWGVLSIISLLKETI